MDDVITLPEDSADDEQNRKKRYLAARKEIHQAGGKAEWREVGERLRQIRLAKNLRQNEVATLFGIQNGQGHISSYERGINFAGRNTRLKYITLLQANSDYIDNGTMPMFKAPTKKSESLAEQVLDSMVKKTAGNLRVVTKRDLGQFLNTGYSPSVPYPFVNGDCYSLPVATHEMGKELPFDSQVICTRLISPNALLIGKVYAFQTDTDLFVRTYGGMYDEAQHYRLKSLYGDDIVLPVKDIKYMYFIERVDKPIE